MRALVLMAAVASACAATPVIPDAEPFSEGMTRPVFDKELFAGAYTQAAREARIEGLLVVKCVVLADGTVRQCRQMKPLPLLGDEMVSRLEAAHLRPATRNGKPVSVNYVFNFQFKIPR